MVMRPRSILLLSENLALSSPWVGGGEELGDAQVQEGLPKGWRCAVLDVQSLTCPHCSGVYGCFPLGLSFQNKQWQLWAR